MKQTYICNLILVCALGCPVVDAKADEAPAPQTVRVEALIDEALRNNSELRLFQADIDAAKAGRTASGQIPNPELSADVGQKTIHGSGPDDEGVAWSVSVVVPFEWPGRIGLRKAIANRDVELAELGMTRFRSELSSRVRMLAYELTAAQEKAAASQEVADRLTALRDVLVQRSPAGLTPLLETRIVEATELTAQRTASEAAMTAQNALLELNMLRGGAPDTELYIDNEPLDFQPLENKNDLLAAARTNNFDIQVRAIELAQQGSRIELAKNERYSSIAVGPTISEEDAGDRERIIGLGFSMPLPLWNRNKGNIDAAVARLTQAEVSLGIAERELEHEVLAAAMTYEAKLREMAKWRPDAVQQFREAAEVADRHYRLGAVSMTTFIELQQHYLDVVESVLATKKEALQAAQQLKLLTGLPALWETTSTKEKTR